MKEIYKINLHNIIHVVSIETIETFEKLPVDEKVAELIEFALDEDGFYLYSDLDACFVDMLFVGVNPMHEYYKSIIINHKRVEKLNELYE